MGVPCSKKSTGVVVPFGSDVTCKPGNGAFGKQSLILGRHERTLKARQILPYDVHTMQKPTPTHGQPWTDETFPHDFDQDKECKDIKVTWMRPQVRQNNFSNFKM